VIFFFSFLSLFLSEKFSHKTTEEIHDQICYQNEVKCLVLCFITYRFYVSFSNGCVAYGSIALPNSPLTILIPPNEKNTKSSSTIHLAIHPNGAWLFTAKDEGENKTTLENWYIPTNSLIQNITVPSRVTAIQCTENSLFAGGVDSFVYIWDLHRNILTNVRMNETPINTLSLSSSSLLLAAAGERYEVVLLHSSPPYVPKKVCF
jgi:hypothetical protein